MAKNDGFFNQVNSFFKRVQNQDLINFSTDKINVFNSPQTQDDRRQKQQIQVFRQYLQSKNWNLRHLELYDEYRRMDSTFPIINAALRLYSQEICVTGDTVINVGGGDITIDDVLKDPVKKLYFSVKAFDIEAGRIAYNTCHGIKHNGKKEVYEVVVARNIPKDMEEFDKKEVAKFKCTINHKILCADKQYRELGDLKVGDLIMSYYQEIDPSCNCKKDRINSTAILSITKCEEEQDVYDLINIFPNHNFTIKLTDLFHVVVHNCNKDEDGKIIKIISDDLGLKQCLEECFDRNLKLNSKSYHLVRSMLKYGNTYSFLQARKGVGVTDLIYLPPEAIRIQLLDNSENLDDFKYHWHGYGSGIQFEPWELVHWRNVEDIESEPYGQSILRSIVDTWRRIVLMREALVIYRIVRAPQRLLHKIDTTGMDPDAAVRYSNEIQKNLHKKPLTNPTTGEIDFKYNPISIEENYYLPTYEGDVSDISVLEGASNLDQVEDYKIIKDDLFAGLLIPKSYLTFEEDLCLRQDTLVRTNEGTIAIKDIAAAFEKNETAKMYALSCNEYGYVTDGKILWCKQTKKVDWLHRVTLSNGKSVECTDNHPFLMASTMTYKRADELVVGDSIKNIFDTEITVLLNETFELEHPEFVYDLEIEEHHNFALDSTIFVHNSNKSALSQEDLRFNNAVSQYQTYFIEGLLHIALVHLHLNGYSKDDMQSFEIQMNNSSTLKEKTKLELLGLRMDAAQKALDDSGGISIMSYTEVLRNILKFSDEEIAQTFRNQMIEKKLIWKLNQLKENGFYEEPDPEKKKAKMKGLDTADDVFKDLQFEAKSIESILSKKIDAELAQLTPKLKASKKQIEVARAAIRLNESKVKSNVEKTLRDLGSREVLD
jgi:intein/homing endonuclease